MNSERFLKLVDQLQREELEINRTKGREYSTEADVLADFRAAAEEADVPMRKAIYILMQKHWRAIATYAREGRLLSCETLRDRVLDLGLYAKLLLASAYDEREVVEYMRDALGEDPDAAGAFDIIVLAERDAKGEREWENIPPEMHLS